MKLSVIVPIYNSSTYLKECLESLILNDNEIEFILIDDGSKDDSLNICESFLNKGNVRIFSNENHGVSFTRNFGIKKAKGKWIMFVDSDDLLSKDWNKIIKKYLDKLEDAIFFSNYLTTNKNMNKKEILEVCLNIKTNNYSFSGPFSKIYKKDFLIKNNILFNEKIINGEDMLFNSIVILKSNYMTAFKEKIYIYRVNGSSSTKKWNDKYISSDLLFRTSLYKYLDESDIFNKIETEEIKSFIDTNAKIGIIQRLAFSNDYSFFSSNIKKLHKYDFKKTNKIDIKKKIILNLFNMKLYRILYILFNHKLKKLKKIDNYTIDI